MKPVTKWAERVYETRRIPEMIDTAFRQALSGKPGPVYLDLPGDVLFQAIDESSVKWPAGRTAFRRAKPQGDPDLVGQAVSLLAKAQRPVIFSGSGVIWSGAVDVLQHWVDLTGIPIYTTPQGRGVVPEDNPGMFPHARSAALKDADFIMVIGTRLNYVFGNGLPPRINGDATMVRIDIDPVEIGTNARVDIGIVGDAGSVLEQFIALAGAVDQRTFSDWRNHLHEIELKRRPTHEQSLSNDNVPIHPLRLCKEIRNFMDRDAVLVVDGQEILNYGRQSIPTFTAGHRLNSGPFGIMGVGLPFGIGAKVARPDKQVIVLHGDGSFGMNGMELDTARRHNAPVLVIVSLNGGWTADPSRRKPGRDLGYTRYDEVAKGLGCHGEYVEKPQDIRPALERAYVAVKAGKPALVNVVTDRNARAVTVKFSSSST